MRDELVYQLKLALSQDELELDYPPTHLLVDEYQDLNPCDLAVIQQICNRGAELFCAGDDDQSIYGFRYAEPEGIRRFGSDYSPNNLMELTLCKRCSRRILDLALYVARQDYRRLEKNLRTDVSSDVGEVQILRFNDQNEEAKGIGQICKWLIDKNKVSPENIIILMRSDHYRRFSNPIAEALNEYGLPVLVVAEPLAPLNCPTDKNNQQRTDGRMFLCLLRLFVNHEDHLAWRTLFGLRRNGIGESTFEVMYELARKDEHTFSQILQRVKDEPRLVQRGNIVKNEVEQIENILDSENPSAYQDLLTFIQSFSDKHIVDENERAEICELFERIMADQLNLWMECLSSRNCEASYP